MRDVIDERDFRERSSRSIVKGYNIHYMTPEEMAAQNRKRAEEKKEAPVPKKIQQQRKREENIPSAQYGKNQPDDPVTQEQIAKILEERKKLHDNVFQDVNSGI